CHGWMMMCDHRPLMMMTRRLLFLWVGGCTSDQLLDAGLGPELPWGHLHLLPL
ncbi:hypothetical protein S245_002641, partial [Arachis hypogaea]